MTKLHMSIKAHSLLFVAAVAFTFLTSITSLLAEGRWQQNQPMEAARSHLQAAVLNNEIYVAGGAGLLGPEDTFALYDPIADYWIPQEALPGGREQFGMTAAAGKAYIAGGFVADEEGLAARDFWAFDPNLGEWLRVPNMPAPRAAHSLVAVNDKLYVLGGIGAGAKDIFVFDINENSWSIHTAKAPQPRSNAAVIAVADKIYVIGGTSSSGAASSQVDIFDTSTGKWVKAPNLPMPRAGLAVGLIGNTIHVAGGATSSPRKTHSNHFIYNLNTKNWQQAAPLPTPRYAGASATVNDRWYVIGGGVGAGFFALFTAADVVESFGP